MAGINRETKLRSYALKCIPVVLLYVSLLFNKFRFIPIPNSERTDSKPTYVTFCSLMHAYKTAANSRTHSATVFTEKRAFLNNFCESLYSSADTTRQPVVHLSYTHKKKLNCSRPEVVFEVFQNKKQQTYATPVACCMNILSICGGCNWFRKCVKVTRERLLQICREGEGILIYAKWPRGQFVNKWL